MVAAIIGLAVWRLMNSTGIWWTIVLAMAIVGTSVYIYYILSGKKEDRSE